ncbi:hypothetical protein [Bacillus solimangrovi]|nr:hypothetical protein [Bacillus solimangrovi]
MRRRQLSVPLEYFSVFLFTNMRWDFIAFLTIQDAIEFVISGESIRVLAS